MSQWAASFHILMMINETELIHMSYHKYGISHELVYRIKVKMKNPVVKERVKMALSGVTKHDLQDRTRIRKLIHQTAKILDEKLTEQQYSNVIRLIMDQKIDPNNTFHLIKLWGMFR
jgi:tRNA U54 and U55 pseudouridine synthase Pus10